jgi:hypothetical protein
VIGVEVGGGVYVEGGVGLGPAGAVSEAGPTAVEEPSGSGVEVGEDVRIRNAVGVGVIVTRARVSPDSVGDTTGVGVTEAVGVPSGKYWKDA